MREQLRKSIDLLRQRVNSNRRNEENIQKILRTEPASSQRSEKLDVIFNENKRILEENHESIGLQLSIIKYLGRFTIPESVKVKVLHTPSNTDYFQLTINGDIEYNSDHPMFGNEEFYNKLMLYYISQEKYEMCSHLQKLTQDNEDNE